MGFQKKYDVSAGHQVKNDVMLPEINLAELHGNGPLYKVSPLAKTAKVLLIGSIPRKPAEPVLWTHKTKASGQVVYTSLGHPDDFKEAAFNRLLRNAIRWAADLPTDEQRSQTNVG
jgi:hypothetical protein